MEGVYTQNGNNRQRKIRINGKRFNPISSTKKVNKMAKAIQLLIAFISFIGAIFSIPYIDSVIRPMIPNVYLVWLAVHGIAFILLFYIFPKILTEFYLRSKGMK